MVAVQVVVVAVVAMAVVVMGTRRRGWNHSGCGVHTMYYIVMAAKVVVAMIVVETGR